ncbi:hypothetical protein M9H77_03614 [Catharanthus roseus]|uniref:Uncharacterized protein n=2 Tax=Catharanthus roseus TaxID=4058 RepID=A0ACC0CBS1_CATRO|nr:hypothetical protein M9H77_03614 [Catharanthus roseus]QTJ02259.1 MYB type transcription factor [Catharanthus roseus]
MKERQRWQAEEDALLRAYARQYGPREWHLVSERMNKPLNRDPKACLERWKNYLKPGIKKGSLTEEEQRLVIHLQTKYGNKWKRIAAEIPGRTAKRLGKWWEVFKEKQQREQKENRRIIEPTTELGKYNHILETFAEKLVKQQQNFQGFLMATPNGAFIRPDTTAPSQPTLLPPWLSNSPATSTVRAPSPSVTLSLSPSVVQSSPAAIPWMQPDRSSLPSRGINIPSRENPFIPELLECCKELEEKHGAWVAHKKEAAWRLRRVELQLESEKACKKREKMEEIEAKVKALREEQKATLERIEAEYREQLAELRRDADVKEQKLADQWAAKHSRLVKFLEQMGFQPRMDEPN